jgi:hypothetical protein
MKRFISLTVLASLATGAMAQSFFDGFNGADFSGNTPAGGTIISAVTWNAFNNSSPVGTTGWFNGNTSVFAPHEGTGYIGANFNNTTGANTIDNWLMSPVRSFQNGDVISFFTRTGASPQTWPDRLHLRLSLSGASTNINDFGIILLSVNPNLSTTGYPGTWTQFSATITGLSGATNGRFAFNYNVTNGGPSGANSDYIGIDSVNYQAVPEPATLAALGLGALAFIRRRRK